MARRSAYTGQGQVELAIYRDKADKIKCDDGSWFNNVVNDDILQ